MECNVEKIGSTNPDIAGVGILVAFATQAGFSLILSIGAFFLALAAHWVRPPNSWSDGHSFDNRWPARNRRIRRSLGLAAVHKILQSITDVQTFNGLALLIAAIVQRDSLSLYHQHIVYDTVNFTSVSFTASILTVWISEKNKMQAQEDGSILEDAPQNDVAADTTKQPRKSFWSVVTYILSALTTSKCIVALFCAFYLTYAILFGRALSKWNANELGHCYLSSHIAALNSSHPYVDKIYLGLTCFYTFGVLMCSMLYTERFTSINKLDKLAVKLQPKGDIFNGTPGAFAFVILQAIVWFMRFTVVSTALLQYPLHLYMVCGIRAANKKYLQGDPEDSWGFGQVVALILLLPVLKECVRACIEYREKREAWTQKYPKD